MKSIPSLQPNIENAINFYAPEARPVIIKAVAQAIEEGQSYDLELPFITAKGKSLWIRTLGQPEFRDGKCVRLLGAFQDITERKHAEEALREVQSRLEAIFAAIPSVVLEYDTNGKAVRANEAALKILGVNSLDFTRDQAVARSQFRNFDGSAIRMENLPTSRALWGEMVAGDLYRIRTADGVERFISTYTAPFYKEDGNVNGVVAVWHDVTELKQAEEALRFGVMN